MLAKFCHCFVPPKKKFCHCIFAWFCHCRCLWISNFISEKGSSRDQLEKSVWINWLWGEACIQEYLRGFPCDASLHSKLQMENHNYSTRKPLVSRWDKRCMKPSKFILFLWTMLAYGNICRYELQNTSHQLLHSYTDIPPLLAMYRRKVRRLILYVVHGIIYWNQTQPKLTEVNTCMHKAWSETCTNANTVLTTYISPYTQDTRSRSGILFQFSITHFGYILCLPICDAF